MTDRSGFTMKIFGFGALLMALFLATYGRAEAADDVAQDARSQYKAALKKYDGRDFASALPQFLAVEQAIGSPNAALYAARCLRELGRLPEAYDEMTRALTLADDHSKAGGRYADTREAAFDELSQIAQQLGMVVITVGPAAGLEVSLNDGIVGPARYGKQLPVVAGNQLVEASAPDYQPFREEVFVSTGSVTNVTIELIPVGADGTSPSGLSGLQIAGFVVAGFAVVNWVAFAVTGTMAQSKYDEVSAACGATHCVDPAFDDEIAEGQTLTTVANVALVGGILGSVASGALFLFDALDDEEAGPDVAVSVTPQGWFFGAKWGF